MYHFVKTHICYFPQRSLGNK